MPSLIDEEEETAMLALYKHYAAMRDAGWVLIISESDIKPKHNI